jgi:hypothetical protein
LPEQNYLWSNTHPTEYVVKRNVFPNDFNPFEHNIHTFFQARINEKDEILKFGAKKLYCFDPYVIHRKPTGIENVMRTMVRISFTQIEIADVNNTINPLIKTEYTRDGIKAFRQHLKNYDK